MPNIDLSILNQRQTPAFYASSLATRPAFGFAGRIFIDTDSPSTGLYRDTGAAWVQIADPGAGTTGTLQQVTTNGKTTNQGITITAGGLTLGTTSGDNQTLLNLPANTSLLYRENAGSLYGFDIGAGDNSLFLNNIEGGYYQTLYFGDGITTNIFGISASDDTGATYNPVFVVNQNKLVGINTNQPGAALDVHSAVNVIAQLNQTLATSNSLLAFQNNNSGLWRIGSFYNAGANDFGVFDVVGAIQPITIKKTTGQVLIGTSTVGSGKLVVSSSTSDNGVQIVGASAPSLRIDNAESGPTLRAGLGISTAANNFIQGSANRDFCIFNGTTALASPILFGIYDAGTVNVQEAARISAARNFLIGTTTDTGVKLNVNGTSNFASNVSIGSTGTSDISWGTAGGIKLSRTNVGPEYALSQRWTGTEAFVEIAASAQWNGGVTILGNGGGSCGIGTLTPGSKLDVSNTVGTAYNPANTLISGQTMRITNGSTNSSVATTLIFNAVGSGGGNGLGTISGVSTGTGSLDLTFAGRNAGGSLAEGMRLTGLGNLLIGTTTDAGQKLQVNGTAKFNGTSGSPVTLDINSSNSNCDITMLSSNSSSVSRIRNNTNDLQFHTNGTLALTLASNQAATFSSSIAIANTVTAAVGIASTHKVSILINGVQYYLLASNV
jgi:hypothetical protein